MNRRLFLKAIAAAPVIAAVPALVKADNVVAPDNLTATEVNERYVRFSVDFASGSDWGSNATVIEEVSADMKHWTTIRTGLPEKAKTKLGLS